MVVGSEWLLLSAAQRELRRSVFIHRSVWLRFGLSAEEYKKKEKNKHPSVGNTHCLLKKKKKKRKKKGGGASYFQASLHSVLHPNLTTKSLIFNSHIVSSAFH